MTINAEKKDGQSAQEVDFLQKEQRWGHEGSFHVMIAMYLD